ncbi:unnamed protein product [Agarophyton chilense]
MVCVVCMCPNSLDDARTGGSEKTSSPPPRQHKRKPGRPPTYVFSKPDHELSENERRLKGSVIKRRIRQNRQYHRKRRLQQMATANIETNTQSPVISTTDHSTHAFSSAAGPAAPPLELSSLPVPPNHSARLNSLAPHPLSLSPLPSIPPPNEIPFSLNAGCEISTTLASLPAPQPPSLRQMCNSPPDQNIASEAELEISARHALSDSNRMMRIASNEPLLAAQLATRIAALPINHSSLSKLLIFPSTFDATSALAVLNVRLENAPTLIRSLVDVSLLSAESSGRYFVSQVARELLSKYQGSRQPEVQRRFILNYAQKLLIFGPEHLHCDGNQRQLAMKLYDDERGNMDIAVRLSQSLHTSTEPLLHRFLAVSATVMRYSVSASNRVQIFSDALNFPCPLAERRPHARIRLALAEAYLDLLSFSPAKQHLETAIANLAMYQDNGDSDISSVLALLLLAEVRASERELQHAKSLLSQALRNMRSRSMERSSYAACCLLTLASVYSAMHEESKALFAVNSAIDVLVAVNFKEMPIHADALRALGRVLFRMGEVDKAQKLFMQGLKIVQNWMARPEWHQAPFQHCPHLDVFLVELVAWTFVKQDRTNEASALFEQAKALRRMRNLDETRCVNPFEDAVHSDGSSEIGGAQSSWLYSRHLY